MQKKSSSIITIVLIINILLTALKLVGGLLFNSISLVSDGINSLSDIFVSTIMLIFLRISYKPRDLNHPYGHEKYEGIVQIVLSFFVLFTGGSVIFYCISSYISSADAPTDFYAIIVSIIALISKISLFSFIFISAKKRNDSTLKAESLNHLGDILATSIGLLGIIFAVLNMKIVDLIASIIIGLIIIYSAITIFTGSLGFLTDEILNPEETKEMKDFLLQDKNIISVDSFLLRKNVRHSNLDLEITVNGLITVFEGHEIAEATKEKLLSKYPSISTCIVHINPFIEKVAQPETGQF